MNAAPRHRVSAPAAAADSKTTERELDRLGNPDAVTLGRIQDMAEGNFGEWIRDRKNRRTIPHRLESCGYVPIRNPDADDGLWRVHGKRQSVYAKTVLPPRDQIAAARAL